MLFGKPALDLRRKELVLHGLVQITTSSGRFEFGRLFHCVVVTRTNIEGYLWRLLMACVVVILIAILHTRLNLESLVSSHLILHLHSCHLHLLVLCDWWQHA